MKRSENERCKNCAYWERTEATKALRRGGVGDCRKMPPTVLGSGRGCEFPEIHGDCWCGEFEAAQ
jgi:hypothetical protein